MLAAVYGTMESILWLVSVTPWKHFPWNFLFRGGKVKKNHVTTVLPSLSWASWKYGFMGGHVKWGRQGSGWTISVLWSWGVWKDNLSISLFQFIHPSGNLGASRYLMVLWSVWVRSQWKGYKFSNPRHELTCSQWRLGTSISFGDTARLFVSQQDRWFYTKTSTWIRRTVSC